MPSVAAPMKRTPTTGVDELVTFENAPYPIRENRIPGDGSNADTPFFTGEKDGRRFHVAPRGGTLFEDETYSDRRSLLVVPPRFDPTKPGAFFVLFLHGNLATLSRDVAQRQGVPRQLIASQQNAALVAPQLAVNALDSSPGRFYEDGFFQTYMQEAADHISARSGGRFSAEAIDKLPVVVVAYSGGYLATAFTLRYAMPPRASRIKGVILLDALFGEEPKFEDWLVRPETRRAFFVSAYSASSAALNGQLKAALQGHQGIDVQSAVPKTIGPGTIVFRDAGAVGHNDFVTQAWIKDPLADLLRRIRLEPAAAAP